MLHSLCFEKRAVSRASSPSFCRRLFAPERALVRRRPPLGLFLFLSVLPLRTSSLPIPPQTTPRPFSKHNERARSSAPPSPPSLPTAFPLLVPPRCRLRPPRGSAACLLCVITRARRAAPSAPRSTFPAAAPAVTQCFLFISNLLKRHDDGLLSPTYLPHLLLLFASPPSPPFTIAFD